MLCTFFLRCGRFLDCFCQFTINFLWPSFLTKDHKLENIFLWPLSLLESSPQFFCTILMKLWFLKIQNRFFFGQNFFGQNITYSASSCSKPVCFFLLLNTNEDICKNLIKLLMIATDLHSICFHTKLMPAINCLLPTFFKIFIFIYHY